MARKEDMTDFKDGIHDYKVFVFNETSVGKNGQNIKKTDIQLVQFFLRRFFEKNPSLESQLPPTKTGKRGMQFDGKYGLQTEKGITIFQDWCVKQGKPIRIDGLVSVQHSIVSASSGNAYTIWMLNAWYNKFEDDPNLKEDITIHMDLFARAPELVRELIYRKLTNRL